MNSGNVDSRNGLNSSTVFSHLTNVGGESRPEHPADTSSPSSRKSPAGKAKNIVPGKSRAHPSTVFREDYRKHGRITYLEAAHHAGVAVSTIHSWIGKKQNALPVCARVGVYRIDLIELEKYLRRGIAK